MQQVGDSEIALGQYPSLSEFIVWMASRKQPILTYKEAMFVQQIARSLPFPQGLNR